MKNYIGLILLCFLVSPAFAAKNKTAVSRKVSNHEGQCSKQAGAMAVAIAKSIGQKTKVEKVVLLQADTPTQTGSGEAGTLEIYNVKLKGEGFSSAETNGYFMIKLWDHGEGCAFQSATLEDAAG